MTVAVLTSVPIKYVLAFFTSGGGMHTAAKPYSIASVHKSLTSGIVVVGFKIVWSIKEAIFIELFTVQEL
jgi:hypothetical protein